MFPIKDQIQLPGKAFVYLLLIAINAFVFYLELTALNIEQLIFRFAAVPENLTLDNPQNFLTLITAQFMHGGWFHIISNMWFLAVFGPNIERIWGSARFLLYYLAAGVFALFVQLIFTTHPNLPILGASGAIAGILGAYFVYFPNHKITSLVPLGFIPIFIGIPAGIMLLYWFGLQFAGGLLASSAAGGVAFFAHIGGFIAGVAIATLTKR